MFFNFSFFHQCINTFLDHFFIFCKHFSYLIDLKPFPTQDIKDFLFKSLSRHFSLSR